MFASLTKLFSGTPSTPAGTAFRPAVEELGDRIVPYGGFAQGSNLYISGTEGGDTIRVSSIGSTVKVDIDNVNYHWQFSGISFLIIQGYGGNDFIVNDTNLGSYAYGGDGNDTIWGGGGSDTLYGGNGTDVLAGRAGDDWLYGEAGYDRLYGGYYESVYQSGWNGHDGMDRLDGGYDNTVDYLYGGTDTDYFYEHYYSSWWSGNTYQYELIADYSTQDAVIWVKH